VPTWKKSNPQHKPFNCTFAWHYKKSGLYIAVYDLLGSLTSSGKTSFFSSIERVATYFDADYETVRRIFKQLVKEGWLHIGRSPSGGRAYFWIDHTTWAAEHPGKCCERSPLVWENEADPLVGKLYAICNGKLRLYEGHVAGIKKLASDEEILELFRKEVEAAKAKRARGEFGGTAPKEVFFRVYRFLKRRPRPAA
jgi:hypothetical protein